MQYITIWLKKSSKFPLQKSSTKLGISSSFFIYLQPFFIVINASLWQIFRCLLNSAKADLFCLASLLWVSRISFYLRLWLMTKLLSCVREVKKIKIPLFESQNEVTHKSKREFQEIKVKRQRQKTRDALISEQVAS